MKFRIIDKVFLCLAIVFVGTRASSIVADANKTETPCLPYLAIPLPDDEIEVFENGSLLHDGHLYPPRWYWQEKNLTYGCACEVKFDCVRKCCPPGEVFTADIVPNCSPINDTAGVPDLAPEPHHLVDELKNISGLSDRFSVIMNRQCHDPRSVTFKLNPDLYDDDNFVIQSDGTLYATGKYYLHSEYCIDWNVDVNKITAVVCDLVDDGPEPVYPFLIIISIPFLIATLIVYAIIPQLKNLYGMTLMCYVACLLVAYCFLATERFIYHGHLLCSTYAFIIHFSFLASFFWLNVMCFDIWWTFGGFRSLQGSVKQRERKKFIIYSVYAWGCASLLTGICLIMDFVPSVPDNFIKPEFGIGSCWFNSDSARALYFYGPMGITVVCNICLFISTALKIIQHKKDTAHHLKGMDSRRHDDNKQWFNLYLKLFIVMGINWSMEIISWLCKDSPQYVWYITDLANTLQGLIIFVIFVWKDKIKRLLLKRLGCKDKSFQSRNSTRSAYHSSASRTCTTTAGLAPLHEKANPYAERAKTTTTDESDCV